MEFSKLLEIVHRKYLGSELVLHLPNDTQIPFNTADVEDGLLEWEKDNPKCQTWREFLRERFPEGDEDPNICPKTFVRMYGCDLCDKLCDGTQSVCLDREMPYWAWKKLYAEQKNEFEIPEWARMAYSESR